MPASSGGTSDPERPVLQEPAGAADAPGSREPADPRDIAGPAGVPTAEPSRAPVTSRRPDDGPGGDHAERSGTGRSHGTVRDKGKRQGRRADSGQTAVTGRLLPLYRSYRRAAARAGRLARRLWWLPGAVFAAVTQLPALVAVAWLVPGTAMLLAGRLLPAPMLIIFIPLAIALCYFAMRRLPVAWPRFQESDEPAGPARRPDVPLSALLATLAIAAGFAVWQAAFRSQELFAVGGPAVYLQYGYWIAGHAAVRIPASAAAFGTASGGLIFTSPGFYLSGGSLTPAFLPGLPLVLAGGTWLGGTGGALLMPAVLGGCAVLSFAGLVGRLAGARWAPAGALVLAVCLPEVYVSRTPFSEPLVQVLLFGGLCLLTDSLLVRRSFPGAPGPLDAYAVPGAGAALAGLGGLALGLTVLADIGSLSLLLPAFPVLAMLFVARRPQAGPFGAGLFLGIGTGLAVGLLLARSYLSTLSSELHLFGLCAAGFGVVTALVAPLAFPSARTRARRLLLGRPRASGSGGKRMSLPPLGAFVQWAAFALPVLVLVGLALRPYFQTVRGQTDPTLIRQVAALQRIAGLPVDGRRQYYELSLSWVLWYLGVPAVLMACAGAAVLGRRSVRAALEWRSSVLAARLWGLPFLIIAWSVVTVLWDPAVAPWQPAASHRLVPVVLPGLVLLGVWISSRLTARAKVLGASRSTAALVSACCVLALAIPPLVTTLNPGLAARPSVGRYSSGVSKLISRVRLRGVGASSTYGGSVAAAAALCAAIGPGASVVFTDTGTAAQFAPAVRGLCGDPAATMPPGSTSAAIEHAVTAIERTGRRPVLLGASRSSLSLFGVVPQLVVSLRTAQDAQVLTGPPAGTWPAQYTVWMASPLGAAAGS